LRLRRHQLVDHLSSGHPLALGHRGALLRRTARTDRRFEAPGGRPSSRAAAPSCSYTTSTDSTRPRTTNTTRAVRRVPALSAVTVTPCRPGRAARPQTAGSRAAATRAPRTRSATDPGGVTRTTNRAARPGRTARALGVTRRPNPRGAAGTATGPRSRTTAYAGRTRPATS